MNALDLSNVLHSLCGIVAVNDGGTQFEAEVLQCINKTLLEVYTAAPSSWLSEVPRSEVVRAPVTSLAITVTQDSKAITFAAFASWMLDCTIIIAGDPAQNQLVMDGGASVSLVKPYNGPSATTTATVYQDSVNLGTDVFRIASPLMLERSWELVPVSTWRDLQLMQPGIFPGMGPFYGTGLQGSTNGYGGMGQQASTLRTTEKQITRPFAFYIARTKGYQVAQNLRIALSALPDIRYAVDYMAQVIPFASNLTDTSNPEFLPFHNDEAILVPWLKWNFAAHQNVTVDKATLKPDFDAATAMLKRFNAQPFADQFVSKSGW